MYLGCLCKQVMEENWGAACPFTVSSLTMEIVKSQLCTLHGLDSLSRRKFFLDLSQALPKPEVVAVDMDPPARQGQDMFNPKVGERHLQALVIQRRTLSKQQPFMSLLLCQRKYLELNMRFSEDPTKSPSYTSPSCDFSSTNCGKYL